jgi:hypothetical protein
MKSFIDAVITDMGTKKGVSNATIARVIQNMGHKDIGNRIALAYVKLNNDRTTAKRANQTVAVKPEQLLSFVQQVMNQICWSARRLVVEQLKTERSEAAGLQAAGIDFSERTAEEVDVESVSTNLISEVVADDHFFLSNVHAWLAAQMSYLDDIQPLEVFVNQQQEIDEHTGEIQWVVTDRASSFDEAMGIMEHAIDTLKEEDSAKVGDQAMNLDFQSGNIAPAVEYKAPSTALRTPSRVKGPGLFARLFGSTHTA